MSVSQLALHRVDFRGVTVLVPSGPLGLPEVAVLRRSLLKVLFDEGRVLVDIARLVPTSTSRVALFPAVLAAAGGWPHARLVLFGDAGPAVAAMTLAGRDRYVPLAPDRTAALGLLDRRPPRVRRSVDLPDSFAAPTFARAILRDTCADWEIDAGAVDRAEVVVDELVTNAVRHTAGSGELLIAQDARGLRISVRDQSIAMPTRPTDGGPGFGRGLRVVAELSLAWGVTPHLRGKTVWAVLPAG